MPMPRTPKAKAKATGRDKRDPARFDGRNEPVVNEGLGDPPPWLKDNEQTKEREAWATIKDEIPWLNRSHRIHVAGVCKILGRIIAGQDVGVQALNLMRQGLGQMGATPSDASKVGAMPGEGKDEDDYFFNQK